MTVAASAFRARVSTVTNVAIRSAVTDTTLTLLLMTFMVASDDMLVASVWASILTEKAPEEAVWLARSTLLPEITMAPRLDTDRGWLAIDIMPMSHTGDVTLFMVKELPVRATSLPRLMVMELTALNTYHAHALPRVREEKLWLVCEISMRLSLSIDRGSEECITLSGTVVYTNCIPVTTRVEWSFSPKYVTTRNTALKS